MSSSAHAGHTLGSTSGYYRPATIAELAAQAQENLWDPSKGLKHWLRTAEKARRTADALNEKGDYEHAFVEYAKAATIVLEKLPTHREYQNLLNADQRHNLGMNGQDILDNLSQLKPILIERYEQWQAKESATPGSSRASSVDPQGRDDPARRREEERAREAREAARREEAWKQEDISRRQAEERERQAREEVAWRQGLDARRREDASGAAEARRASEARALAESERASQAERQRREQDEERARRWAADEKRRQEQEGIVRRQQESEAVARAARREVASRVSPTPSRAPPSAYPQDPERTPSRSMHAPQPHRPSGSQSILDPYGPTEMPAALPLENPSTYDDDSSTDLEGVPRDSWSRRRPAEQPTKSKQSTASIVYPTPVTTTSPPPPDLGPIRYPSLMTQHQLTQGYVPSLQSMFAESATKPHAPDSSSSLLFEAKPSSSVWSMPHPRQPAPVAPVIPPPPPNMPMPAPSHHSQASQSYPTPGRGQTPSREPSSSHRSSASSSARIVPGGAKDSNVKELKTIKFPRECLPKFLSIARVNTLQNRETCGLLLGKDKGSKYVVTTLLIPKQNSTSETCHMEEEQLVLQFTEERKLFTLGWIHTHPTQSCFMSSVDLHTQSGFQRMLPESFAVVCAPHSTPTFGLFRLTDPGGLQVILECTSKNMFHPHPDMPIYTDCDNSHVQMKELPLEIVDLR